MNDNGYYQNSIFSEANMNENLIQKIDNSVATNNFIENILSLNIGKKAKVYVTIPNSNEWQNKIFDGIIEQTGNDYIILSNPDGEWYVIRIIYLDFIIFEESVKFK